MSGGRGISVVIPHRNAGARLSEAVSSVLQLSLPIPWEIIVIDDCSDDIASREALDRVEETAQVIRLTRQQGVQCCRNVGLNAAGLPLVLPLDADDRLVRGSLGFSYPHVASTLLEDRDIAFVHTASVMFGAFHGLTIGSYPLCEAMIARKHHVPTAIVYRREDALAAGGYDSRIRKWQDWSFAVGLLANRRAKGIPNEIEFVTPPGHEYRVHDNPGRISRMAIDELGEVRKTVERNGSFFREVLDNGESGDALAASVLAQKPSRLEDLLFMAAYDLDQARHVASERNAHLRGRHDELDFP
jgi:glycosyltransferase involved in cell wall biosynthesis